MDRTSRCISVFAMFVICAALSGFEGEFHLGFKHLYHHLSADEFKVERKEPSHSIIDLSGFGDDFAISGPGVQLYSMYSIEAPYVFINTNVAYGAFLAGHFAVYMLSFESSCLYAATDSLQFGLTGGLNYTRAEHNYSEQVDLDIEARNPGTFYGVRVQFKWEHVRMELSVIRHNIVYDYTISDDYVGSADKIDLSGITLSLGMSFRLFGH